MDKLTSFNLNLYVMKKVQLLFKTHAVSLLLLMVLFLSTSLYHVIKASPNEPTATEISQMANKGPVVTWYNCMQSVTYGGIMPVRQCGCCCWQWFTSAASGMSRCGVSVVIIQPGDL